MSDPTHYAIRGGIQGRERLRLLGRVMHDTSSRLFDRLGLADGMACLDAGCGGGDATLEIGRRVAPTGRVVGVDLDGPKIEIARTEAAERGAANVTFEQRDIHNVGDGLAFDVIYSRFLLTHLSDPADVVRSFHARLRPGGLVAVEDIDFHGHFSHPPSRASERYRDLYCAVVHKRGGDPDIGPKLPRLLLDAGFVDVDMTIAQPAGLRGESKLLNPITLEAIAGAVIEDGLATRDEVDALVDELYEYAADPTTIAGLPRIVQTWGRRLR